MVVDGEIGVVESSEAIDSAWWSILDIGIEMCV